jgi:hypothetical protein
VTHAIPKLAWAVAEISLAVAVAAPQLEFPTWKGKQLGLAALWQATPIVAVGDVDNVSPFGEQTVDHLPPPVIQDLHKLYWCQGDFHPVAIIKGELPNPRKKYLWASVNSGCKLFYGNQQAHKQEVTRIWFLREEGKFLRPTFDGGSPNSYGLLTKWVDEPHVLPPEKLGVLLLTPSANSDNLREYAETIWNVADIACSLLGKSECVQRIRGLTALGNSDLRKAACEYLRAQQGESCSSERPVITGPAPLSKPVTAR